MENNKKESAVLVYLRERGLVEDGLVELLNDFKTYLDSKRGLTIDGNTAILDLKFRALKKDSTTKLNA